MHGCQLTLAAEFALQCQQFRAGAESYGLLDSRHRGWQHELCRWKKSILRNPRVPARIKLQCLTLRLDMKNNETDRPEDRETDGVDVRMVSLDAEWCWLQWELGMTECGPGKWVEFISEEL